MADVDGDSVDDLLNEATESEQTGGDGDLLGEEEQISELAGDDSQASFTNEESTLLNETNDLDDTNDEAELEAIKNRMKEMEEEAQKLREYQAEADDSLNLSGGNLPPAATSPAEKKEIDGRSIYVGNVDYGATAEELESHFHGCGSVNRVTILCDKYSGHPKGFAYVEFADPDAIEAAKALDESLFRGRQIKVVPKRTNIPGHSITNRPPRGRGRGFRARGFRGYRGRPSYRGAYRGRGRYSTFYSPY